MLKIVVLKVPCGEVFGVGRRLFFFWPYRVSCVMLVPQPGIKPRPLAVEARNPNHWTTRKFCIASFKKEKMKHLSCLSSMNSFKEAKKKKKMMKNSSV